MSSIPASMPPSNPALMPEAGEKKSQCTLSKVVEVALFALATLVCVSFIAAGVLAFVASFPLSAAVALTAIIVGGAGLAALAILQISLSVHRAKQNKKVAPQPVSPSQPNPNPIKNPAPPAANSSCVGSALMGSSKPAGLDNSKPPGGPSLLSPKKAAPGLVGLKSEDDDGIIKLSPKHAAVAAAMGSSPVAHAEVEQEESANPLSPMIAAKIQTLRRDLIALNDGVLVKTPEERNFQIKDIVEEAQVLIKTLPKAHLKTKLVRSLKKLLREATLLLSDSKKASRPTPSLKSDPAKMSLLKQCRNNQKALDKAFSSSDVEQLEKALVPAEKLLQDSQAQTSIANAPPVVQLEASINEAKSLLALLKNIQKSEADLMKALKAGDLEKVLMQKNSFLQFMNELPYHKFSDSAKQAWGVLLDQDLMPLMDQLDAIIDIIRALDPQNRQLTLGSEDKQNAISTLMSSIKLGSLATLRKQLELHIKTPNPELDRVGSMLNTVTQNTTTGEREGEPGDVEGDQPEGVPAAPPPPPDAPMPELTAQLLDGRASLSKMAVQAEPPTQQPSGLLAALQGVRLKTPEKQEKAKPEKSATEKALDGKFKKIRELEAADEAAAADDDDDGSEYTDSGESQNSQGSALARSVASGEDIAKACGRVGEQIKAFVKKKEEDDVLTDGWEEVPVEPEVEQESAQPAVASAQKAVGKIDQKGTAARILSEMLLGRKANASSTMPQ